MKGFMLLFLAFGLFAAIGDNGDVNPQVYVEPPVVEEVVPTVTQREDEKHVGVTGDPVIYEDAVYEAEVEFVCGLNETRAIPLYVKDGIIYSYTQQWNGEGYDLALIRASVDGNAKSSDEVILFKNDPAGISTYYVYPADDGGYIGIGNCWSDDGEYSEYFLKYDKSGTMVSKRSVTDSIPISFSSLYFDKVVCDGTNLFIHYQGYRDSESYGGLFVFNEYFELTKHFTDCEWAQICIGKDKNLYAVDGYSGDLWSYNPKTLTKTNIANTDTYSYYIFPGQGNEIIFGFDKLQSLNTKTKEVSDLFNCKELGFTMDLCELVYRDAEGNIVVLFTNYDEPGAGVYKATVRSK